METQEDRERRLNEIMQKLMMKHYLRVVMRTETLNKSYMSNVMRHSMHPEMQQK
jgi:hypothetical protein